MHSAANFYKELGKELYQIVCITSYSNVWLCRTTLERWLCLCDMFLPFRRRLTPGRGFVAIYWRASTLPCDCGVSWLYSISMTDYLSSLFLWITRATVAFPDCHLQVAVTVGHPQVAVARWWQATAHLAKRRRSFEAQAYMRLRSAAGCSLAPGLKPIKWGPNKWLKECLYSVLYLDSL
jgi:hypothetical protein